MLASWREVRSRLQYLLCRVKLLGTYYCFVQAFNPSVIHAHITF